MVDLPHTYRTFDEDNANIGSEVVVREKSISVGMVNHLGWTTRELQAPAPTGDDAVALARAVLAAAGDTGHVVMSTGAIDQMIANWREESARSMRSRAYEAAYNAPGTPYTPMEAIRALPLLPDAPEKCAGMFSGGEGVASLCDGPAGHDGGCHPRLAEDFDAGWSAGHTHARADADRVAQLEEQYADLASLVHGHGEDIGQAQAALRGLGQRLTRMEPPA